MTGILRLIAIVAFLAFTVVLSWRGEVVMSWIAFTFSTLFVASYMVRSEL